MGMTVISNREEEERGVIGIIMLTGKSFKRRERRRKKDGWEIGLS